MYGMKTSKKNSDTLNFGEINISQAGYQRQKRNEKIQKKSVTPDFDAINISEVRYQKPALILNHKRFSTGLWCLLTGFYITIKSV